MFPQSWHFPSPVAATLRLSNHPHLSSTCKRCPHARPQNIKPRKSHAHAHIAKCTSVYPLCGRPSYVFFFAFHFVSSSHPVPSLARSQSPRRHTPTRMRRRRRNENPRVTQRRWPTYAVRRRRPRRAMRRQRPRNDARRRPPHHAARGRGRATPREDDPTPRRTKAEHEWIRE
jgi:hypothetical protein